MLLVRLQIGEATMVSKMSYLLTMVSKMSSQKIKELSHDPAVSLLGIFSKKTKILI